MDPRYAPLVLDAEMAEHQVQQVVENADAGLTLPEAPGATGS